MSKEYSWGVDTDSSIVVRESEHEREHEHAEQQERGERTKASS